MESKGYLINTISDEDIKENVKRFNTTNFTQNKPKKCLIQIKAPLSQYKSMLQYQAAAKKDFDVYLSLADLIKICFNEFKSEISTNFDLEKILKKYNKI